MFRLFIGLLVWYCSRAAQGMPKQPDIRFPVLRTGQPVAT